MVQFKETSRDSILIISVIATFCGIITVMLLTTGLDVPMIMAACTLAIWTGVRPPVAR